MSDGRIESTDAEKHTAFEFLRELATGEGASPRLARLLGIALQEWHDLKAVADVSGDTARMDWMDRHLCRAGEVRNDAGQTVKLCRVWSIMGELETLRETIDAMMAATDGGDHA